MSATVDSGGRDPESLFRRMLPVRTGRGAVQRLLEQGAAEGGGHLDGAGQTVVIECRVKVGRDAAELVVEGAAESDLVRLARVPLPALPPAAGIGLADALPIGVAGVVRAARVRGEAVPAVG